MSDKKKHDKKERREKKKKHKSKSSESESKNDADSPNQGFTLRNVCTSNQWMVNFIWVPFKRVYFYNWEQV